MGYQRKAKLMIFQYISSWSNYGDLISSNHPITASMYPLVNKHGGIVQGRVDFFHCHVEFRECKKPSDQVTWFWTPNFSRVDSTSIILDVTHQFKGDTWSLSMGMAPVFRQLFPINGPSPKSKSKWMPQENCLEHATRPRPNEEF